MGHGCERVNIGGLETGWKVQLEEIVFGSETIACRAFALCVDLDLDVYYV